MGTVNFIDPLIDSGFLEKFYQENLELLRTKPIQELIDSFNREVDCKGWTGTRGAYLKALNDAFHERSDLSLDKTVFISDGMSLNRKIKLEGNKIVPL